MPVSHGLNHCLTVVGHMTNAIEVRALRIDWYWYSLLIIVELVVLSFYFEGERIIKDKNIFTQKLADFIVIWFA